MVNIQVGFATTLAVILHEIPQEFGDFGILIYAGYKRATALLYNLLSGLMSVVGAAIVVILGMFPDYLIHGVIPFAAGVFIYIAGSDLVPELHKHAKNKNIIPEALGIGVGILAMYLLLFLE
jgi:zinc and cadmium transporter